MTHAESLAYSPIDAGLGVLYGPLILHFTPASVHRTVAESIAFTLKLKELRSGQQLGFKPLSLKGTIPRSFFREVAD